MNNTVDLRTAFASGHRVAVDHSYHWAKGAAGTVVDPPEQVAALAPGWTGCIRSVAAPTGERLFAWVQFDQPQIDADGDGPYNAAEIELRFLLHVQ